MTLPALPQEEARLSLWDGPPGRRRVDGAWWPRSDDLSRELAPLVMNLHSRGFRVTRVGYNPAGWSAAPHRVPADGRSIHLEWFASIDPHEIHLTGTLPDERLDLCVVEPGATVDDAHRAMAPDAGTPSGGAPSPRTSKT